MKNSFKLLFALLLTLVSLTVVSPDIITRAYSAPEIVVSEPVSGIVNTPSVDIKGYVTNAVSLNISVNGYENNVNFDSQGFFVFKADNLVRGVNDIRISASGNSGSSYKNLSVTYDPDARVPRISITNFSDGQEVSQSQITLDIALVDTNSLTVKVNGTVTYSNSVTGNVSRTINLTPGVNEIELTATGTGISTTKSINIIYNSSSLITNLKINSVSVSDFISVPQGQSVQLQGLSAFGTNITVYCNGNQIASYSGGTFTVDLNLQNGSNEIVVNASGNGVTESRRITVYYGPTGPQVYDVAPEGTVYKSGVTVTGTIRNADTISLKMNNTIIRTVNVSGSFNAPVNFSIPVTLAPGQNNFNLIATVNSTSTSTTFPADGTSFFTITYENNPVLFLDSPATGSRVYTNTATITGRVFNVPSGSLAVNGQTVNFNTTDGTFSKNIILKPGENTITAIAKNSSGTTVSKSIVITYDGRPDILNLSPASGSVATTDTVTISGTVVNTSQNGLKFFINGETEGLVVTFDAQGRFNRSVKLTSGDNTIKLTATDGYNTVTKTLVVKYSTDPVIVIDSPRDSERVVSNEVTIKGSVFNTQTGGLIINGQTTSFNSKTGAFSKTVILKNLTNDITIKAVNGKLYTEKKLRIYYSGAPAINLSTPVNGSTTDKADVIFQGSVFPANPAEIRSFTINGIDCKSLVSDGSFKTGPITLSKSGENKIDMVLETTDSRTVTRTVILYYNDGPEIKIWSPLDGSSSYSNVITIRGKVSPADTLKIGNDKISLEADGTFSHKATLKSGKNELKLSAAYGKTTVNKTLTIYYNQVIKHGAEIRTEAKDNSEIKAFDDMIKIKLPKGSVGTGTVSVLSVTDPDDLDRAPEQSAFIGPVFKIDWDGHKPVKPYKLTLKYDGVVAENQSHKVSMLFYDTNDDEWQVLGGHVDARSQTVSVETDSTGYFAASLYFYTFDDLNNHWGRKDIEFLTARGAVAESRNFKPDQAVTRAEFVTFLVKTMGLTIYDQRNPSYKDVDEDHWAYDYIETALRAGLVTGFSHNRFLPDRYITREEAAIILVRAANMKPLKDQELNKILNYFSDSESISSWAKNDVAAAVKGKLLSGSSNRKFMPYSTTTRSQAAAMIARLSEQMNKNLK